MNRPEDSASRAPQIKSPGALDMQRGSRNHGSQPDFKSVESLEASNLSTSTKAQQDRALQAMRRGPKTTDELRALGIYQVSARIFGLRALGYSIRTDLFDGYAADGMHHARLARYTLIEPDAAPMPEADKQANKKRFATLAAQFAIAGHALTRSTNPDAKAHYYVARWGWLRPVRDLDQAEQLLQQIRGAQS